MVDELHQFYKNSMMFMNKCTRPDKAEYTKILQASIMGVLVMGFIGYMIKLVFIPINNIILSNWGWPNDTRSTLLIILYKGAI